MGVKRVVKIIMKRDNLSEKDAKALVGECIHRIINEAIPYGDLELATEIIMDELGLEPDYLEDLL